MLDFIKKHGEHEACDGYDRYYMPYRDSEDSGRYFWDNTLDDWTQYDTDQDAWYFGVWVNKEALSVFTYAEGDVSYVVAHDIDCFNRYVEQMNEAYGEGSICTTFGDDGMVTYVQDRSKFLIKEAS